MSGGLKGLGLGIINRRKEGNKKKKTSYSCDTAIFSFCFLLSALSMYLCLHVRAGMSNKLPVSLTAPQCKHSLCIEGKK